MCCADRNIEDVLDNNLLSVANEPPNFHVEGSQMLTCLNGYRKIVRMSKRN
jgi:hypothetical protein